MKETMKNMNEEQKQEIREWLIRGEGHSVAPMNYYTDMGLPTSFLEPMVKRTWSNFVQVPKGITKIGEDEVSGQPIGWAADKERWVFLLTPEQQENNYIEVRWSTNITSSRIKQIWADSSERSEHLENKLDEHDEDYINYLKKEYDVHPDAKYWSYKYNEEYYNYRIEFKVPIVPKVNWENEHVAFDVEEKQGHFLVKYDGTKRTDFINGNKAAWHRKNASKKPITKKAATEWVRKQLDESPSISTMFGRLDIDFKIDGKRRPIKDIAQDYWQQDRDEIEFHKKSIERITATCPDIIEFIKSTKNVPIGWIHEQFQPMGYTDVMWNNNFMMPWVDGISSTRVIAALADSLGVDLTEHQTLGRGSTARAYGKAVLNYLEEECDFAQLCKA